MSARQRRPLSCSRPGRRGGWPEPRTAPWEDYRANLIPESEFPEVSGVSAVRGGSGPGESLTGGISPEPALQPTSQRSTGYTLPAMGETRVDLLHLLEDLRDAYPGATEETILTEIVANSLDSGATTITITTDPTAPALTIVDDGMGMRRRELARYHDIAASTKVRGERIGFAGVGIKVGLLVSREVLTETRLGKHHVATSWGLSSRHRAPWRWVAPPGLVVERGTAVRLTLGNALSPLLDPGFIEGRRSPTLPTAPRPRSGGDAVGSLPSRRVLRRQRNTAREAGLERAGRGADRGAPRAQAQACGRRLHGARPPADSRGAPRHRGEHVRQGDQTWLGLARRGTPSGRARRRPDRGARPRPVPDAPQGRLRPRRPARRNLPRVSQGGPGSGLAPARPVGRRARPR